MQTRTSFGRILIVALTSCLSSLVQTEPSAAEQPPHDAAPIGDTMERVILPDSVPDPLERMNRVVWGFNKGVMTSVVNPSSKVYRFIVVKPIRRGIGNIGRNIRYPGRLINNLLEAKWTGARDESYRFLCNTVLGVGGFFDLASKWKIPKSDKDFGETFGYWGWKPSVFLMLPIAGPSNDRDFTGLMADTAANPLTYFPPYSFVTYGIGYNNLTDTVDDYVRLSQAEMDPYSLLQYAWTFARENEVVDYQVRGEQDKPSLETLQSVFFGVKDPEFPRHRKTRSVLIPGTGQKLDFTFWLQRGQAPVLYIVPGLGSHRLAGSALALAELAYGRGFSAVCVSSPFNSEFMEHASTAALPAYTPVDGEDLHVALTEINSRLEKVYPGRLGSKALLGYSMGGFHSLFIAATESSNQKGLIKFDRYVAVNSPVRLLYGVSKLDDYFQAPLKWPSQERTARINNTFLKVASLSKTSLAPNSSLPFSAVESKFLIGLAFRFILRDIIFSSQQRHNQGILEHPVKTLRREAVFEEILGYSYQDYLKRFVVPYYQSRNIDLTASAALDKAGDLRTYAAGLRANHNIRIIENQDDILLADEDLEWFHATFSPEQLTVFEQGGHLGNLAHPAVQKAILEALDGLGALPLNPKKAKAGLSAP